jgi:hypothetical protein
MLANHAGDAKTTRRSQARSHRLGAYLGAYLRRDSYQGVASATPPVKPTDSGFSRCGHALLHHHEMRLSHRKEPGRTAKEEKEAGKNQIAGTFDFGWRSASACDKVEKFKNGFSRRGT